MDNLEQTPRITLLKEKMLNEPRYVSIEQARIITSSISRKWMFLG